MLDLILAFLIDLAVGDPYYSFHPVRLMGKGIAAGENLLRHLFCNTQKGTGCNFNLSPFVAQSLAGGILAIVFPFIVLVLTWMVLILAARTHFLFAFLLNTLGIYMALSIHDLRKEALQIHSDLRNKNLIKARQDLGRIVGRDTERLDEKEILRASIETVAESTVDGIVSPLFYAAIGGAPLALAYKAVNTLDSMIGHQNEKYRNFGFMAAKQDDLWNWIPARVCYLCISFAAFFVNGRMKEALFLGREQGLTASSGISAIPEATFAGALGIQLGGTNYYEGREVVKPLFGYPLKELDTNDLLKSIQLMMTSSWIALFGCLVLRGVGEVIVQLIF